MTNVPTNEISPDLQAATGLSPWVIYNSSSRLQMVGSHVSQFLVVKGAEVRRNLTLAEREFGTATFKIKIPCNAEILEIIEKYPKQLGIGSVEFNPSTVIVYRDLDTGDLDCLTIPRYHSLHQHFGFPYKMKSAVNRLYKGATIAKDTVLADSPNIDDHGNYMMGIEANVAFMSIPGVIEDGVVISESLAEKLTTIGYEHRQATWGENSFPLNLYGTEDEYKPFPEIGQPIRDDGLLFALRRFDSLLAPVEMSPKALMTPDYNFDRLVYAKPNAKIIDISIRNASKSHGPATPTGMDTSVERYFKMELSYYDKIIETYQRLKKEYGLQVRLTPKFHALIVEAYMFKPSKEKQRSTQIYQRVPMDDWRVEVTFEYDILPTDGFKITDLHGGKGVICDVWPDANMPINADGIRADCIMDGDSTIKRMNIGRMYEQHLNATSHMLSEKVRTAMMADPSETTVQQCWEQLTRYYQIVSPAMHEVVTGPSYTQTPRHHVESVAQRGIYLYMPTDNQAYGPDMVTQLMAEYPVNITPVTYRGKSGQVSTTVHKVLIGSLYIILLEKTGEDYSAVASSKLQHFGIPAKLTKQDRYAQYARAQPVRLAGETEVRLMAAYMGGEATSHLLEMSNNPQMHKHVVANLLRADMPTNIKEVVDMSQFPTRGSRSQAYISHTLECAGIVFESKPYEEIEPTVYREET